MVEKIQLEFKNTLSHPVKRLLALLNAFDQPSGGTHLFLEILPCLLFRRPLLSDHAAVKRAYAQSGNSIIIQVDDILAGDLLNENIRQDSPYVVLFKTARRFRFKGRNEVCRIGDLIDSGPQI